MIVRKGNPANIAVHHSAVKPGAKNLSELKARAKSYDAYHKTKSIGWGCDTPGEKGYKYIRYHWLIAQDGSTLQVQDEKYVVYHASDGSNGQFNYYGIGVCLDGNYEEEVPTDKQKEALAQLIARFEKQYKVNVNVRGHKEVSQTATACPGKNVGTHSSGWLKGVIARANEILSGVNPVPQPPQESELDKLKKEIESLKKELSISNEKVIELQKLLESANNEIVKLKDSSIQVSSTDNLLAEIQRRINAVK